MKQYDKRISALEKQNHSSHNLDYDSEDELDEFIKEWELKTKQEEIENRLFDLEQKERSRELERALEHRGEYGD